MDSTLCTLRCRVLCRLKSRDGCFLPLIFTPGQNELQAVVDESRTLKNLLRVTFSKNQRNRGHSSNFNLAHTLSIGRPRSHTYYNDVRLLKFSRVWEKST